MIIARLAGGLGNQMFQYAFARTLSLRHNTPLKIEIWVLILFTEIMSWIYLM